MEYFLYFWLLFKVYDNDLYSFKKLFKDVIFLILFSNEILFLFFIRSKIANLKDYMMVNYSGGGDDVYPTSTTTHAKRSGRRDNIHPHLCWMLYPTLDKVVDKPASTAVDVIAGPTLKPKER